MLGGEIVVVVVWLRRVDASSSPAMLTSVEGLECLSVFDFVVFFIDMWVVAMVALLIVFIVRRSRALH